MLTGPTIASVQSDGIHAWGLLCVDTPAVREAVAREAVPTRAVASGPSVVVAVPFQSGFFYTMRTPRTRRLKRRIHVQIDAFHGIDFP